MMHRRSFLGALTAMVPALALLHPRRLFTAQREQSDPGVPRRMDLRKELHPDFADVELRLHGKPVYHAVAYDIDADTVALAARRVGGGYWPELYLEPVNAGVSVHWLRR